MCPDVLVLYGTSLCKDREFTKKKDNTRLLLKEAVKLEVVMGNDPAAAQSYSSDLYTPVLSVGRKPVQVHVHCIYNRRRPTLKMH